MCFLLVCISEANGANDSNLCFAHPLKDDLQAEQKLKIFAGETNAHCHLLHYQGEEKMSVSVEKNICEQLDAWAKRWDRRKKFVTSSLH